MLIACRLAGLSALGAHYAGVKWRANARPTQTAPSVRAGNGGKLDG